MKAGSVVVALYMPHLGLGVVDWVAPGGRLVVGFETPDGPYTTDFDPHELELASRVKATA